MKFDIWTVIFQIMNFVVLLLVLKRILYKPVREIMEKRRASIEKTLADAETAKEEAMALRDKHEAEMSRVGKERIELYEKMKGEVALERKDLMIAAEKEAEQLLIKERALFAAEKAGFERELKGRALDSVSRYATILLAELADDTLQTAIEGKFMGRLEQIAADIRSYSGMDEAIAIELISSREISEETIVAFKDKLNTFLKTKVRIKKSIDDTLIAGFRMKAYDHVYDSSMAGQIAELKNKLEEAL